MDTEEKIAQDYIYAYKQKDSLRLNVLRLVKTSIKNRLVELCQPDGKLSESEIIDILVRQAKQRQDSIDQYRKAKRDDLADKEFAELQILREYLPTMIEGEELNQVISNAIEQISAKSGADMGKVMKFIMEKHKGSIDGRQLSEKVKAALSKPS